MKPASDFHARAQAGWGGDPPDWVVVLADACSRSTQTAVAAQLGVSGSQLSQALANTYDAPLGGLEQRVRGALMGSTVHCKVLGQIGADRCIAAQKAKFSAASNVRIRLYHQCRGGCPHSRIKKEQA